jgi:hypothetical protein
MRNPDDIAAGFPALAFAGPAGAGQLNGISSAVQYGSQFRDHVKLSAVHRNQNCQLRLTL